MESQPQNPEFRNNPENFNPCYFNMHAQLSSGAKVLKLVLNTHLHPYFV